MTASVVQAILRSLAAAGLAVALVALCSHPSLRAQVDATKTRAYALSERSARLLGELEGDWSITVAASDAATDQATRRQIDEVLRRFADAAPSLRTARLDPTDPAALAAWEALMNEVAQAAGSTRGAGEVLSFAAALDAGENEALRLAQFSQREAAGLATLPPAGDAEIDRSLAAIRSALAEFGQRGGELLELVHRARSTSPQQPLPDDDAARALLVANHAAWSEQLAAASSLFAELAQRPAAPEPLRRYAASAAASFERQALDLRVAQDRLSRIAAPPLAQIGRQLAAGEAAVIVGPPGVVVVPAWQLFPSMATEAAASTGVRNDRRFRGEQVLASAIASMLQPQPLVVILHAEEKSMLRDSAERNDLVAAAETLRAARIEVEEWMTTDSTPPSTSPSVRSSRSAMERAARPTVYLVVPPQRRSGVEISPAERVLLDRTRRLVDEGKPVLLTLGRSMRPLFRQEDPWATLAEELGAKADSGSVILELDRLGPGRGATRAWQRLDPPTTAHPISAALAGHGLVLTHPLPLLLIDDDASGAGPTRTQATVLATIAPGERRWLENDWRNELTERAAPPEGRGLPAPMAEVIALERPLAEGTQRAVLVGSGGWLLSSVLDALEPLGGGRSIPANPGNRELLLASTLWLAGLDGQIAPGPGAAGAARLSGVAGRSQVIWSTIAIVVLPLSSLLIGSLVVLARRRT